MKNINPLGLFDDHFLMEKLTKLGDPLQKLNIVDRASFKRFPGLKKRDKVPDSKTFWTFREQPLYADSAYTGEKQEKVYKKKNVINKVIEKGCRNKPLSEKQKASNKEKTRTRSRVEHLFGFVENSMNGSFVRTIGLARAKAKTGMIHPVG